MLWVYGHLYTLQAAEREYKAATVRYNAEARSVSTDNVRIAEAAERVAAEMTKAEKLRNDTAYQQRRAAEAGTRLPGRRSTPTRPTGPDAPSLSTASIELEKPRNLARSSTEFLTEWDWWIRMANFGELALAAITLIYIRNRSAKTNARQPEEFPHELDTEKRLPVRRENFAQKKEIEKKHASFDSEGLKRLREALKDISFRLPGLSFKSYVRGDAVWVLMVKANQGTQETVASAKAKLGILDDALTIPREAFRERLERFLHENGFEI